MVKFDLLRAKLKPPSQTTLNFLFILAVLYMTLFFQLGRMALVGADEPRYARVAEEMNNSGDYIVPMLRGKPWLEKPPLYYWLAAAGYRLFGINEGSARLPAALCGAACVLLLLVLAGKLWGEEIGFFASLMLATSPLFFVFNRAASTDPLLAAFLNSGLLIFLFAFERQSIWFFLASGALLGLATLAKGPIALLLAAMPILPVLVLYPSRRRVVGAVGALAVATAVAVPWFWMIIRRTGFEFVSVFVLNHNLARFFTTLHHHEHPLYYYLPVLLAGLHPWSVLGIVFGFYLLHERRARRRPAGPGVVLRSPNSTDVSRRIFQDHDPKSIFLGCWSLLPILFFSASGSKLPAYILPVCLPAAVSIALLFASFTEKEYQRSRQAPFAVLTGLSLLSVLAVTAAADRLYQHPALGAGLGLLLTLGSLLAWFVSSRGLSRALLALAGTNVTLVAYLTLCILPVVQDFHSTRTVVRLALRELPASEALFQYRYFHQTVDYYSGGRTVTDPIENIGEVRQTLAGHSPLWVVTEVKRLEELRSQPDLEVTTVAQRGNVAVVKISKHAPER